ncbi:MAG: acyltransferase family protein, partial [Candidatus Sacchiramonaceae bacterium]|nr:acyltransferase family protein [Candidatus Saccharimonadaceae bacterium]
MKSQVSLTSLNKASKQPTRIIYLDLLRILASFFVVLIHVLKIFWDRSATNEQFVVITMFDTVAYVAVPLFFMISGVIFLSPKLLARAKTTKLAFKYIAIYIGWTVFYIGFRAILVQLSRQEIGLNLPADYYADILHYHLWFLPQLIILYFLAPYIRKIINHSTRREVKNLLKLFIFGVLIYTFVGILYGVITQQMSENWSSIDMSLLARITSMISPFSESFAISAGYF